MKFTPIFLATALLLAGCQQAATTTQPTKTTQPRATKMHIVTANGLLYAIGSQHVFLTGTEITNLNSAAALRAHFKDGVRLSEGSYLSRNTSLSVYVVHHVPTKMPAFAKVQLTTKVPAAQTLEAHTMMIDLADTAQIPSLKNTQLTRLN